MDDLALLTFHGFAYDGKTLLARQVEVEASTDPGPRRPTRYRSTEERRELLKKNIEDSGMSKTFSAVEEMFAYELAPVQRLPERVWGLSITLQRLAFARIDFRKGSVIAVFFPRAIALCLDEFRQLLGVFRYETYPRNREPLNDRDAELRFEFTAEEWEEHKERLSALTTAVYEAWENSGQ